MASSSSSEPKNEILRLAGADFLPLNQKLRPLIMKDDPPKKKETAPPSKSYELQRLRAIQILNTPDHAALQELITNLETSRVNKRIYMFCKSNYPNSLSLKLSHLFLNSSNNPAIKSTCAQLLHFLLDSPDFWDSTSHVIRTELKIAILEILKQDNPKMFCMKMWKMASQIFTCIIDEEQGEWHDMLSFFCESLNSGTIYIQDSALMFFLELPTCLHEELSQYVQHLRLNFWDKFNSSKGERKVHALAALVNLVLHMSSDYYSQFRDLLMPMVKAVSGFLDSDVTEDNARTSLMKLAELSGAEPRFFDSHLNEVFDEMVKIGFNDELEEQTRYLSVEMMYAFDDIAIKRVKRSILGRLFHVLMQMISLVSDKTCYYLLGETFMQRISLVRGEKLHMPIILKIIPEDMASSDWRKRYTAVTIIGAISKGCAKALSDNLAEVMKVLTKSLNDSSPDVIFAAIKTVKAMSVELPPHTLDQQANLLITWLLLALSYGNKPVKQAAAASAIRSLCENCSSSIVEPRLESIVSRLLELLQSEHDEVQAESLNTLTSFAISSKDFFRNCYDLIITSLKKHLAGATSKSLRDKSVECIWTVGMAVAKDIFTKDATEVVALLLSVRWYLGEDDHSLKVNLLRAWEQLLICLGSHFHPYVKDLMPDLLHSARLRWNSTRDRVILTEKLKACKLLLCLTKQFKGELFPWINQVSEILLSLVKFHDGDIRKIAFSVMPKLLLSAKLSIDGPSNSHLHKLVLRFVKSLLEALDEEIDGKVCAKIVKSLTKCIEIAGGFLSKKKIQQTANVIERVLKATSRKHFSQEEDVTDLEKKIIEKVVYYIHILTEIYEESSKTLVDKILECIRAMMRNDATAKEKEIALLTFNEISLKCKEAANRF
ncbi:uncharacterized protein LOC129877219 [Solanum dulcamara]|uniref:uncharacterized protein LOC129877219 n=1 Tax=Solanum dulcamara TaxID=45834 RepID=UPI002485D900|nr:uncharacterized protein LOC129877219 [Solanum dulcamara]